MPSCHCGTQAAPQAAKRERRKIVSFDPHAVKIYVDGNCWDNPGGSGGFAVRVEYGCDLALPDELVECRGYFKTNNNRMELHACIFGHEWTWDHIDELGGRRILILTDSTYVYGGYSWAISWSQNDYRSSEGRPIKNEDLWKELMTLRRKLSRRVRIEVMLISRRSDASAKEVDRTAKAAGNMPSHVDWGFPKGKIGRSKNSTKQAAKLYPAAGQEPIIRIYHSTSARRDIQALKFQVFDEVKRDFFEKFEAYAEPSVGNELHRTHVYHVRMNDVPRYPKILEIIEELRESDIVINTAAVSP
jgi:ribonuclease HI